MGWSASRVGRDVNHAKSASARVLRGRLAGSSRGDPRAGRAAPDLKFIVPWLRSRSRRPGLLSAKKSLVQWHWVERAPRCPRCQPRQVRQRACAPWAVGRFSTGRSARGPHATGAESFDYVALKARPPNWRGVVKEKPRPSAWGGARLVLAAKTTTPSLLRCACSMGGLPFFSPGEALADRAPRE